MSTRSVYLKIGYVNKKKIALPDCVNIAVANRYSFLLTSLDVCTLGILARRIRALRPPNPYTLRGIFLNREVLIKKQGKSIQY
jgi:large subunit ribosomal protein L6